MKNILLGICGDSKSRAGRLWADLSEYAEIRREGITVQLYESAESYLRRKEPADVLLLNTELRGISGIQLKNLLAKRKSEEAILFVAEYSRSMKEAFGKNVYGFLEQPIRKESLFEVLDIVMEDLKKVPRSLGLPMDQDGRILLSSILYIKAADKYVEIYTDTGRKVGYYSLKKCEEVLDPTGFARVHRSYLIHFMHVAAVMNGHAKMSDGTEVPLARGTTKQVRKEFYAYRCSAFP
ncbi:MAG: LytTR family transcriptional regulator DNA-binding domain-containing protein [Clostridium sp.]|jgi:DNA-binding LytR/AlgR family response regulator|nr:LytTR family transcriptional regulator DNA-binding domain-containing protein [Clostridium sp.]